jgi:SAM-dependent methyltransferase
MTAKKKIYETLPLIYNYVMKGVNYQTWAKYIYLISKTFIKKEPRILELAGGNLNLANLLSFYYPDILVTDASVEMLSSDPKKELNRVACDMTMLPFKGKFDIIFSTFDSINYLTSRGRLLKLFKEVSDLLDPNGIFTFDVSLENNSLKHSKEAVRKGTIDGVYFTHKSEYSRVSRIHKNIFKIKIDEETVTEVHKQKIYPFELYFEVMEKAGLYVIDCLDAFSFKKGNAKSERVQFIARKVI